MIRLKNSKSKAEQAAGILADAQAGLAQAQGQAAMMEGIGSIASGALGAFGGGGGGGAAAGAAGLKTTGIDYSSAFSNPNFMTSIF